MRFVFTLGLAVGMLASCTAPKVYDELSHMRKSEAITAILQNIDQINYDESYSEIDRDRLRWSYARDFENEVSALIKELKVHPPKPTQKNYQPIITLLEGNMKHLKGVIEAEQHALLLPAIQTTKQTCTQCHILFAEK